MPRAPSLLLLFAVVLAAALTLMQDCAASRAISTDLANAAGECLSKPILTATQLALPDSAVDSNLSSESPKEPGSTSRLLGKRAFLVDLSACRQTHAVLSSHRVSPLNWVCSYLPQSEFRTVLSRFRI